MMAEHKKAIKAAFPFTIPVLTGYLFLGMAYGIMMSANGFAFWFTAIVSVLVFAGSAQYIGVGLLVAAFNPVNAFIITLTVNARQLFYGISMLDKYKDAGKVKPFLIFALTDETFSILCSRHAPKGINQNLFMMYTSLLDYIYWIVGSTLGGVAGSFIKFNTEGIDFALTALFIAIMVNQWKENKNHISTLIGFACSAVSLVIFGADKFIIPAMIAMLACLTAYKPAFDKKEAKQ